MNEYPREPTPEQRSLTGRILRFCLTNKLVVWLMVLFVVAWGLLVMPFDWKGGGLPRDPVPVDAIPDIGEKQQIVFTEWPGRSPQDVQDQVTFPMTTALLGVPGVKAIRSISDFGFSSIYILFGDREDFYASRTRVLEKLNSLPAGTLPSGVMPMLGPDATALGQVFWYTLEGRTPDGNPAGGWDLEELRTIQDWYVRYGLYAEGVSEVASVGGFVREYQVDVDPDAMRAYGVTLAEVRKAVEDSNLDVGAKVIEINRVEYMLRGVGFIKNIGDIENSVIKQSENVPVLLRHVAHVTLGPELRRGALDKAGAQAVGGVVVTRYGANPLAVIQGVKSKIAEIAPGLPAKAVIDFTKTTPSGIRSFAQDHGFEAYAGSGLNQDGWMDYLRRTPAPEHPPWVSLSKVTIVPFYDRTGLIYETLGTLNSAIVEEVLITIIVVVIMTMNLRSSLLIGSMMPLAVLMTFIAMKQFHVDANIVSLSGIAIAIGTIVDMGIVISDNILHHLDEAPPDMPRLEVVHRAASEVGSAVMTSVATTVVGFLPVFFMTGAEGRLFRPLAFTKTFALISSIAIALTVLPPAAHVLFCGRVSGRRIRMILKGMVAGAGVWIGFLLSWWVGGALILIGSYLLAREYLPETLRRLAPWVANLLALLFVGVLLSRHWEPLGPEFGLTRNFIFVALVVGGVMGLFFVFRHFYARILGWCLEHKLLFLSIPMAVILFGASAWLGFDRVFGFIPDAVGRLGVKEGAIRSTAFWVEARHKFPGMGREFMPPLDEGSYLYMPTIMPHASIGEALEVIRQQDLALQAIPEVDSVVGKLGRADTPLDPAPVSMIETVVSYKPEYATDSNGRRTRQWRDHIQSPDDIWREIVRVAQVPGSTAAPRLQPIAARLVMLQSGMRAPMGVKVRGPTLDAVNDVGLQIERFLKEVSTVESAAVIADRVVGKPYLEIVPDREALARYGVPIRAFQDVVEGAIGGERLTTTVEGRERFPVRVRYPRELRDDPDALGRILVPASDGTQIPLQQLAEIRYVRGPQMIKSEDTFLVGYILFDSKPGNAEVDVVETCQRYLQDKVDKGELVIPAGVSYAFAGSYENQVRSQKTLQLILPLALFAIFLLLYFQFHSVMMTSLVFTGVFVAWAGGFILFWFYNQPWFLDVRLFGVDLRDLFQIRPMNLSVAVWVGFLALFGIATDDGVIMGTYQEQMFRTRRPKTVAEIRDSVVTAGLRRVRPCLMTTATTVLALLPVLTSSGRGADIMIPMAIPSFGGMAIEILTMLVVPVLYCGVREAQLKKDKRVT